jgi:transposase
MSKIYSECPECHHPFDSDMVEWMKKRVGRWFCPFCHWTNRDFIPANYWARDLDTAFEARSVA